MTSHTHSHLRVLVTGGAGAVGSAICERLAGSGAHIFVCDIAGHRRATQVIEKIQSRGGTADFIAANVAISEDVDRAIDAIGASGGFQSLVHAAAPALQERRFRKSHWEDFQAQSEVAVHGGFNLVHKWLNTEQQLKPESLIFVLSSVTLGLPPVAQAAYATAKYGLLGLAKSLASELGPRSITVNCVSPGLLGEGLTKATDERVKALVSSATPLGRLATCDDVAGVVAFLTGPDARAITGLNVPVCGGASV